jgi:hypothetical protein
MLTKAAGLLKKAKGFGLTGKTSRVSPVAIPIPLEHKGTWQQKGSAWVNDPMLGAELLANGSMEEGSPPTGWLAQGSATLTSVAEERTGGSGSNCLNIANGDTAYGIGRKALTYPAHIWHRATAWARKVTCNSIVSVVDLGGDELSHFTVASTSWMQTRAAVLSLTADGHLRSMNASNTSGQAARLDDASFRALTLSELILTRNTNNIDTTVDVTVASFPHYEPVGIILNVDNLDNPQNFVLATLGSNTTGGLGIRLLKCVNGVYSVVMDYTNYDWSAGKVFRVVKSGTTYQIFFNGIQIGANQTVNEATINNNTRHGIFSTNPAVNLDNVAIS